MSLRARLNQPVVLVHPVDNPTGWDWGMAATRVATFGRLDQQGTLEESTGWPADAPDTSVTTWLLFLGPTERVRSVDHVEQGGRVFEVVGQPNAVFGRRGVHHLEVQLRSVMGDDVGDEDLFPSPGLFPSLVLVPAGD